MIIFDVFNFVCVKFDAFVLNFFELKDGVEGMIGIKSLYDVAFIPLLHVNDDILVVDLASKIEFDCGCVVGDFMFCRQSCDFFDGDVEKIL